jgi:hypothetical protein
MLTLRNFLLAGLCLYASSSFSQNLLANGSFEDVNICEEFDAGCSPAAWFFARQISTKGYYTSNQLEGTSGSRYIGLVIAHLDSAVRHYWQTRLLCPMESGRHYIARIRVAAASDLIPNPADIGFYFSDGFLFSRADTVIQTGDYLRFNDARVKKQKYDWFLLEKTFTASKSASHMAFGNFSAATNHRMLDSMHIHKNYSILIDDVSLEPVDGQTCPTYEKTYRDLYTYKKRHQLDYKPVTAQHARENRTAQEGNGKNDFTYPVSGSGQRDHQ